MKTFNKILCLFLAAFLCLAIIGCDEKKDVGIRIGAIESSPANFHAENDYGEDAVVGYDDEAAVIKALASGEIDIAVINNTNSEKIISDNKDFSILEEKYAVDKFAFCFQRTNETKNDIDTVLKELIDDGTVQKIVDKYTKKSDSSALVGVPVKAKNTDKVDLVMALSNEFSPYEYIDSDKYYGISVEIAKLIADDLDYDLIIKEADYDSIIPDIKVGKYTFTAMPYATGHENYDYTTTYANETQIILTSKNSKIKTLDDLTKFKIS